MFCGLLPWSQNASVRFGPMVPPPSARWHRRTCSQRPVALTDRRLRGDERFRWERAIPFAAHAHREHLFLKGDVAWRPRFDCSAPYQ
jgi:hypothetical protein